MSASWHKSPKDYSEFAIDAIRMMVAAGRSCGMKTCAVLEIYAPALAITSRRARRIFERDRNPHVGVGECRQIVSGVVRVRRGIADRLRQKANELDRETDALELQEERQLTLWVGEWGTSKHGGVSLRRAA